jgi:hypothetical protein
MVERWSEAGRRCDGLAVVKGIDGFLIMPHAEGLPVDKCPCCDKTFLTQHSAQRVADFLFPMPVARPDTGTFRRDRGTARRRLDPYILAEGPNDVPR